MYLGIDVGGTKTLVGALDERGVIVESQKFPTPQDFDEWAQKLSKVVASFATKSFRATSVAIPATRMDRVHGIGITFGNLNWRNVPVQETVESIVHTPVVVENDAKLACLSEAMLRKERSRVLYITISTGIGYALVVDGAIDENIGDGGGALFLASYKGELVPWESFASGKAIVERFGKQASDIYDTATWQRIARDLSVGLLELIAVCEPNVIVVGGSVGTYFERLKPHLEAALTQHKTPILSIPPLEEAKRPEEAVLYGCYDLAKERYGKSRTVTPA